MTELDFFYNDLMKFINEYEKKNILLKVEKDPDFDIVKIFGEHISALARAKNGLNDISELAYATSEHHPYWNLLYNCSEIANIVLDKWNQSLTKEDTRDMEWSIEKMQQSLKKIIEKNDMQNLGRDKYS